MAVLMVEQMDARSVARMEHWTAVRSELPKVGGSAAKTAASTADHLAALMAVLMAEWTAALLVESSADALVLH